MNFRRTFLRSAATILAVFSIFAARTLAQEGAIAPRALPKEAAKEISRAEELAQKLQNPVAAIISVPFQLNYDQNMGQEDEGYRWTLNIQPGIAPQRLRAKGFGFISTFQPPTCGYWTKVQ